ncbi:McrB family protein [Mucilaginibacter sp.]|uniref:McrB family protein n=1 Tax=Mucilaginibacter sp. TaxID=1882438 RepID=UPI003D12897E
MDIPENIDKEHLLKAIEKINFEGIPKRADSQQYDVVYNSKLYPPKLIISYANIFANGLELDRRSFDGGLDTPAFKILVKNGFIIQKKKLETKKEVDFVEIIKKAGRTNATAFFMAARELLNKLNIKQDDERITYGTSASNQFSITLGQRHCLVLKLNEDYPWYFIDGAKTIPEKYLKVSQFQGSPEAYYYSCKSSDDLRSRISEIGKASEKELRRTQSSGFRKSNNEIFEKAVFDKTYSDQLFNKAFESLGNSESGIKNYKKAYIKWLDAIFKKESGVKNSYVRAIELLSKLINWNVFEVDDLNKLKSLYDDLLKEQKTEGGKYYNEAAKSYGNNGFYSAAIKTYNDFLQQYSTLNTDIINLNFMLPLNEILYGPPGTGKTYKLNEYKEKYFTDRGVTKSSEELLKEKISAYPFWKIFAAVLSDYDKPILVSDIMANPIVKAKISDAAKTPQNTIWRILQSYADQESSQMSEKYRGPLELFHKNEKSEWSIIADKQIEIPNIIDKELLEIAQNPFIRTAQGVTIKTRFNFITFHQKYSYEDFIEGIKPLLKDNSEEEKAGDLQFELKKGIFYNSCIEALKLVGYNSFEECYNDSIENRIAKFTEAKGKPSKQFALFIDEINRANISAVFGELITLLEEDKRIGGENEIWLELPYSNEKFCVPANLYIIGTMNTADRSIALLDIALRRRFEFKALYPIYMESQWWAPLLEALNQAIYSWKKNPDFFIGHAFFINKPEGEKIGILNSKIIPLLYEYCQSNTEAVKKILLDAGIQISPTTIKENYQIIAL